MNEKTLNDLKQFITTTVREEITGVREEITNLETRINARFDENDAMQNEILNAIGEIQESQSKAIRRQADVIDNHERRILKLEKRAA